MFLVWGPCHPLILREETDPAGTDLLMSTVIALKSWVDHFTARIHRGSHFLLLINFIFVVHLSRK